MANSAPPSRLADLRIGQDRPHGGVAVLAAVLAQAGRVALDVARIERGLVEGRREQQSQPIVLADQVLVPATPSPWSARGIGRARQAPPRIARSNRSGILRFVASRARFRRRSSRADTIRRPTLRARAPRAACPHVRASGARGPASRASASGANSSMVRTSSQPSQTLSPCAAFADPVHAVVPIAAADQRQAVLAGQRQALVEAAGAMLEQRGRSLAIMRLEKAVMLSGSQARAFEKRHDLIEYCGVAGAGDIVRGREGEPDAVVRYSRAHALARNAAATSAARRLRRTAGRRRAEDVRARLVGREASAPCRPAAGRGSHRRRSPDRRPSARRCGRRASDRAASRSA